MPTQISLLKFLTVVHLIVFIWQAASQIPWTILGSALHLHNGPEHERLQGDWWTLRPFSILHFFRRSFTQTQNQRRLARERADARVNEPVIIRYAVTYRNLQGQNLALARNLNRFPQIGLLPPERLFIPMSRDFPNRTMRPAYSPTAEYGPTWQDDLFGDFSGATELGLAEAGGNVLTMTQR